MSLEGDLPAVEALDFSSWNILINSSFSSLEKLSYVSNILLSLKKSSKELIINGHKMKWKYVYIFYTFLFI